MNTEVEAILKDLGWTDEYIDKFGEAIRQIALLYDANQGIYPENECEGYTFWLYCTGKHDPQNYLPIDADEWRAELKRVHPDIEAGFRL